LAEMIEAATGAVIEENSRTGEGIGDSAPHNSGRLRVSDLSSLRKRHPFLANYSDELLEKYPIETLIKLESTSIKLKNLEKARATEEKLAANRDSLMDTMYEIKAGEDNRITILHEARFLPGMGCSAAKMWEGGRKALGNKSQQPISTYDMKSIGLAGHVTPQGWLALHDPGTSNISLKMFSINNCGRKVISKQGEGDDTLAEVVELGEFKVALRALREALVFTQPWNKSVGALEGFLIQTNYCSKDLEGLDKQAAMLSQFVDYILRENSNRWRGLESFLSIDEIKGAWESFFGARPQSMLSKSKKPGSGGGGVGGHSFNNNFNQQGAGSMSKYSKFNIHPSLFQEDICVMWNIGRCNKAPNNCQTKAGKALRHVCNWRPDFNKPMPPCGANHASCFFH